MAPFTDVTFEDPKTHYRVESHINKNSNGSSSDGVTVVFDNKKKQLWKSPFFVGHKEIQLSPDGKTLALIGNYFFGGIIQPQKEEILIALFNEKETLKVVKLADLVPGEIDTYLKEQEVLAMGGGWVAIGDFVKEFKIEWEKRNIVISSTRGKNHNFSF